MIGGIVGGGEEVGGLVEGGMVGGGEVVVVVGGGMVGGGDVVGVGMVNPGMLGKVMSGNSGGSVCAELLPIMVMAP
ncbi:MAG: hypothetical protein ACLGI2_14165 [Acidimicrobiia bacterium]